jgi:hypothetical protein
MVAVLAMVAVAELFRSDDRPSELGKGLSFATIMSQVAALPMFVFWFPWVEESPTGPFSFFQPIVGVIIAFGMLVLVAFQLTAVGVGTRKPAMRLALLFALFCLPMASFMWPAILLQLAVWGWAFRSSSYFRGSGAQATAGD